MSFKKHFEKAAGEPVKFKEIGHALLRGVKASGNDTIKDTLKMQGLKHISSAVRKNEGIGKTVSTQEGRKRFAEAFGKALPSVGVAGAYGVAGHKVYKKIAPDDNQQYYGY